MKSILLYTLIGCCLLACSSVSDSQLEQALQLSGENRPQLEAVLDFYKNDSLKLKAACYLIKNMPYHYSVDEYYRSPDGQKYRPDIAVFKDKEEMERHCDSLARRGYRTERHKVFDLVSLDSAYLVDNIELAFSVWQKPWAKNISFDDFCGYILPYRAQTEKASLLRRKLMERFMPMLDSARVSTPLEACILLNERLKEIVRYQDTGLPFYPTIDETYRAGIGLCEGICNLGAFVMRAVGIPVAIEFTLWSKMDLGHNWCAVLSDGRFYSFGPGEEQPGAHAERLIEKYYLKPAKVYRLSFELKQRENGEMEDDGYTTFLKSPFLHDVTNEYLGKTVSFEIQAETTGDVSSGKYGRNVYLCIYNFYKWQPLAMGVCSDDGMCVFDNVVGDNIFMVADCPDGQNLRYISDPFYVGAEGKIRSLIPQMQQRQAAVLKKRKDKMEVSHTLFYWDVMEKRFTPLPCKEATDSTQVYDQIPSGALLWFTIPERIYNQRIFFIENDSIREY
ncbi:transglutaminase-like domain-containing protein [Bacteroides sp. UBA939]|uniref:transglutaminase-like domain-containing protein n=1 Tax=Bacteroides sp. UBA939 TaxID=1946092 RepID=UPI0025BC5D3F|nr:transglutaminase-like domain-containing protein [Bacteroides sp. UBA939]